MFRVIALASIGVIVFDTLGSLASKTFGFDYRYLAAGSFLIYAAAGFFGAGSGRLQTALLAGGIVAMVDATLGWAVSWVLGPGRVPAEQARIGPILSTVAFVIVTGMGLGLVGGLFARFVRHQGRGK